MGRPKYKEMYEWEKAAHYATEQELQRFKRLHAETFEAYAGLRKDWKRRGRMIIALRSQIEEQAEIWESRLHEVEKQAKDAINQSDH